MIATPTATMQIQVPVTQQQLSEGIVVIGDAEKDVGDNDGELQTAPEAASSRKVRIIRIPRAFKTCWSLTYYMCSRIYL